MRKFLRGRLQGYGRAYRLNLKDTGWGMKLVVLVITGFFCGALASEYFGTPSQRSFWSDASSGIL